MDQLLTTKLHIPHLQTDIIPRPLLFAYLEDGLTRKLTLVSAPTGFGKSTLVADWLSKKNIPAAWLSLDQGDDDPVRFWAYLIGAVQTLHPEIGEEARQILNAPRLKSTEPIAISLINDISLLSKDLLIVLDDFHLIEEPRVHDSVTFLLEHQPQNLHLILITRVDPSISLARLRAQNMLSEIRAQDLQFSTAETAELLNDKMGLNLKTDQIEILNERTESWIVGLQLAALSLKGQQSSEAFINMFSGSHQFILDYLTEEVLDTLPKSQREFLLRSSILKRFCGSLCKTVTGDPSSEDQLEEIRKRNLFLISLDNQGRWFRYQHLFAEVLNALLERDFLEEISALHLRAAAWFDKQGFPGEAIDHAFRSADMGKARELVLKHWLQVLHQGEIATVLRWLDALPESQQPDPYVPLARCWALFISWNNSLIEPQLEQAAQAYKILVEQGSLDEDQQKEINSQLMMMRSVLARARGEHASSVIYAEEAARLMPSETWQGIGTSWNMLAAAHAGAGNFEGAIEAYQRGIALAYDEGNLVGAYMCTYGRAMYLLIQGRLNEAEELVLQSIERAEREGHGDFPAAGALYIAMARIEMEKFRPAEAEQNLNIGLRITRPAGFGETERAGRYLRAQIAAAHGNMDEAIEILEETARIIHALNEPYQTGELNREWALLDIRAGKLDEARKKLRKLDKAIEITGHGNLLLWRESLVPRLLCAEEHFEEALTALEEPITRTQAEKSNGQLIRLLALKAVALDALGESESAQSVLQEGLTLGTPDGYTWQLLSAGPDIEPLLRSHSTAHELPQRSRAYLDHLLEACQKLFGAKDLPPQGDHPDLLTRRELEILQLIYEGCSNTEIASKLVVTLNTVKKHTSNIYGKLGVRSRTQAIARALELNLF